MQFTIHADGAHKVLDGDMTIGILIKNEKTGETWELSEYVGNRGNVNMAEYLAVYRGMSYLERRHLNGIKSVSVYSDSQFVIGHISKENPIGNYRDWAENEEFKKIREKVIRLKRIFVRSGAKVTFARKRNERAHELAAKAMRKIEGQKHYREDDRNKLIELVKSDQVVLPLSIFKKEEYNNLTIFEALVVELVDLRKMRFSEVAEALNRSYNTVRNTYLHARKKTSGVLPPRKLKKAMPALEAA